MSRLIALVVAGTLGLVLARVTAGNPAPAPSRSAVAFVVALRTFESNGVALADQAAASSSDRRVQTAGRALAADGDAVAAQVWALLDRWQVPGAERLAEPSGPTLATGAPPGDPTGALRHACGLVGTDELGRLALLHGAAFDQRFTRDWVAHAQAALTALAGDIPPAVPTSLVAAARGAIGRDIGVLGAAVG